MSPSDLGEQLKPFVFLDLFEADMRGLAGSMPVHPHSGIATVTVFADGDVTFDDPQAGHGTIGYGGVDGLDNFPGAYPVSRLNDPLLRCGTGQETSSAAIYLASEDAGYITGQCYLVNGGRCFL